MMQQRVLPLSSGETSVSLLTNSTGLTRMPQLRGIHSDYRFVEPASPSLQIVYRLQVHLEIFDPEVDVLVIA